MQVVRAPFYVRDLAVLLVGCSNTGADRVTVIVGATLLSGTASSPTE